MCMTECVRHFRLTNFRLTYTFAYCLSFPSFHGLVVWVGVFGLIVFSLSPGLSQLTPINNIYNNNFRLAHYRLTHFRLTHFRLTHFRLARSRLTHFRLTHYRLTHFRLTHFCLVHYRLTHFRRTCRTASWFPYDFYSTTRLLINK